MKSRRETRLPELLNIAKAYIQTETVDRNMTNQQYLQIMIDAIDFLLSGNYPGKTIHLLSCLSATAFALSEYHPRTSEKHSGIHWKKLALLKRKLYYEDLGRYRNMSHLADKTVYISLISMDFYMPFVTFVVEEIVQHDLPALRTALIQIRDISTYRQTNLIGRRINALVEYINDEYYLAKIAEYADDILQTQKFLGNINSRVSILWKLLAIGEAIGQLSAMHKERFSNEVKAQLREVRLILCHPERWDNQHIINAIIAGNTQHLVIPLQDLCSQMQQLLNTTQSLRQRYVNDTQGIVRIKKRLRYSIHRIKQNLFQRGRVDNSSIVARTLHEQVESIIQRQVKALWEVWFGHSVIPENSRQQMINRTLYTSRRTKLIYYLTQYEDEYEALAYRQQQRRSPLSETERYYLEFYRSIEYRCYQMKEVLPNLPAIRRLSELTEECDVEIKDASQKLANLEKEREKMVSNLEKYDDYYYSTGYHQHFFSHYDPRDSILFEDNILVGYPNLLFKHSEKMKEINKINKKIADIKKVRKVICIKYFMEDACMIIPKIVAAINMIEISYQEISNQVHQLQRDRFDEALEIMDEEMLAAYQGDIQAAMEAQSQHCQNVHPRFRIDHGTMRFYQILAGSHVRALLEYDRETGHTKNKLFCHDAAQIIISFEGDDISLLEGLKYLMQAPRGYLAHLGKRPAGESIDHFPDSAQVFYRATQFAIACRWKLLDLQFNYKQHLATSNVAYVQQLTSELDDAAMPLLTDQTISHDAAVFELDPMIQQSKLESFAKQLNQNISDKLQQLPQTSHLLKSLNINLDRTQTLMKALKEHAPVITSRLKPELNLLSNHIVKKLQDALEEEEEEIETICTAIKDFIANIINSNKLLAKEARKQGIFKNPEDEQEKEEEEAADTTQVKKIDTGKVP